jgi:hypothetical protein
LLISSRKLHRAPSIDASYKVSVHLAKRFQRRRFLEIDQSEKRIVWQPCLLMNRDEMTNLSRGPSKDAPYQCIQNAVIYTDIADF